MDTVGIRAGVLDFASPGISPARSEVGNIRLGQQFQALAQILQCMAHIRGAEEAVDDLYLFTQRVPRRLHSIRPLCQDFLVRLAPHGLRDKQFFHGRYLH